MENEKIEQTNATEPKEMDTRTNEKGVEETYIGGEWIPRKVKKERVSKAKEYPMTATVTIGDRTFKAHAGVRVYKHKKDENKVIGRGYTLKLDKGQQLQGFGTFKVLGV